MSKRLHFLFFLFVFFLLVAVAGIALEMAPPPLRRIAFVAGSNEGGEGLERLRYAESDARSFAAVLQDLGGVRPQDLILVPGSDLRRFEDGLERVRQLVRSPRAMDERRELVFYYSGHSDDEGLILGKDRIAWEALRKRIGDIPAEVKIAILDSCSSGSMTRAKGGVSRPAFLFDASSDMTGQAFLTSASAEEAAQESDRIGGSFFTHYLVSGLRGAADSGDGMVTLEEAYAYAYTETLASTERTEYGPQHPAREFDFTGSGKIVLTDLRSSAAGITVAEDIAGRLYFRDSQGNLAVELNKVYGQKTELGLEPGTYSVLLDSKGTRLGAEVRVSTNRRATLALSALRPIPLDNATARGDGAADDGAQAYLPQSDDPAAALGAAVGAVIGSALGKAAGSAVSAAISAAAAAVADAGVQPAEPQAAADGAPTDAAPTDAAGAPRPTVFRLSVLPDLSGGLFSSTSDHVAAIDLLVGSSRSSLAFEVAGLASLEGKDVRGFQASGLANIALGSLSGVQFAGLVNIMGGDARFLQSAGLLNVSGGMLGAQIAGLVNVSRGEARGVQVAGLVNWARAGVSGVQVAGVANWGSTVKGPQISVVNIADSVTGVQVGVVNIAGHVSGAQVGVLNISRQIDGIPIGILSIEGRGRHAVDLWVDLDGSSYAGLSLGTKSFYTVMSAGWTPGTDPALWSLGLGLGGRSDLGPFFLDYDLSLVALRQGFSDWSSSPVGSMFPRLKVVLGIPLFGDIAVTGGVALRALVPSLSFSLAGADPSLPVFQPSIILGVQL